MRHRDPRRASARQLVPPGTHSPGRPPARRIRDGRASSETDSRGPGIDRYEPSVLTDWHQRPASTAPTPPPAPGRYIPLPRPSHPADTGGQCPSKRWHTPPRPPRSGHQTPAPASSPPHTSEPQAPTRRACLDAVESGSAAAPPSGTNLPRTRGVTPDAVSILLNLVVVEECSAVGVGLAEVVAAVGAAGDGFELLIGVDGDGVVECGEQGLVGQGVAVGDAGGGG